MAFFPGLTMLIPYILTTRSTWSSCKLRVFCLANKKVNNGVALVWSLYVCLCMSSCIQEFLLNFIVFLKVSDKEVHNKAENSFRLASMTVEKIVF